MSEAPPSGAFREASERVASPTPALAAAPEGEPRPEPAGAARGFGPGCGRRALLAFALLGPAAIAAGGLLLGMVWLSIHLGWANRGAVGDPQFGINYDCNQAEYLLLEDPALGPAGYVRDDRPGRVQWCADRLDDLLGGLGAKYVRLSVEWSVVEPRQGEYDFSLTDALLTVAERRGAHVLLSVGMKGQRHPEYYVPDWLRAKVRIPEGGDPSTEPLVRQRALEMVATVVRHAAGSPAIDAWQAENEPLVPSHRAGDWRLSQEYVRAVIGTIRSADPAGRPVAENQDDHAVTLQRWHNALRDADVVGMSAFPFRNFTLLGHDYVSDILHWAWWAPNLPDHAAETRADGKLYWMTELQAEPWAEPDVRLYGPAHEAPDFPPRNLAKNLDDARRIGASRVYLWGAEWWLYERDHRGDARYWDMARAALSAGP